MPIIDAHIRSTVERVRTELASHLSKNEGNSLIKLDIIDVIERSFSNIVFLVAETSARTRRMVMKKVVHDPINIAITKRQNQAVVEYEILKYLYQKFQSVDGCAVPRPILVIPEIEVLLMDFVDGQSLSKELGHARYWANISNFRELQRYYSLCGRWLHHFQKFTGFEMVGAEAFGDLLERCDLRLKLIEKIENSLCPKDIRDRTMNYLHEQLTQVAKKNVMICGRHGDFGHWNIIVKQNEVVVFDFLGYEKESIAYDLLKFLISLETWKNHPAYSNSRLDTLRRRFLEGYNGFPTIPLSVARICEIYHRVSVIHACLSNPGYRWDYRLRNYRALKKNLRALNYVYSGKVIWPHIQ